MVFSAPALGDDCSLLGSEVVRESCLKFKACLSENSNACISRYVGKLEIYEKSGDLPTLIDAKSEIYRIINQGNRSLLRKYIDKSNTDEKNENELTEDKLDSHKIDSSGVPMYGKFCGPGHPSDDNFHKEYIKGLKELYGGNMDPLDAACMFHDKCYEDKGNHDAACDGELVDRLDDIIEDPDSDPEIRAFARGIRLYFSRTPYNRTLSQGHIETAKALAKLINEEPWKLTLQPQNVGNVGIEEKGAIRIGGISETRINGWKIGPQSSFIEYDDDSYPSTKIEFTLQTRNNTPFLRIGREWPLLTGQHRQSDVIRVEEEKNVPRTAKDRFIAFVSAGILASGIEYKNKGISRKLIKTALSTSFDYQRTYGYGGASIRKPTLFVGSSTTLSDRQLSGDFQALEPGDRVSFYSVFNDTQASISLLPLFDLKPTKDDLRLGYFDIRYRRPSREAYDLSDTYNCGGCATGSRFYLIDTDYKSKGFSIYTSVPFPGTFDFDYPVRMTAQYRFGVESSAKIHDTDISIFENDPHYFGIYGEVSWGPKWQIENQWLKRKLDYGFDVALFYDAHEWSKKLNPWGVFSDVEEIDFLWGANLRLWATF